MSALTVSIDDKRALWALTERHLRSASFAAVMLARAALRRHANTVRIKSGARAVAITTDCDDISDEIDAIIAALTTPTVERLHAIEREFGTDLLVVCATATQTTIHTRRHRTVIARGVVTHHAPARAGAVTINVVRDASLRKQERAELRAWLPSPRAKIVLDGSALGRPIRLPSTVEFQRTVTTRAGRGVVGIALDEATAQTTYLARGVWVAIDNVRAQALPIHAIWDHDTIPTPPDALLAEARHAITVAGAHLEQALAAQFDKKLKHALAHRLRARLVRNDVMPDAFVDVPLFDSGDGNFSVSYRALQQRERIIVGDDVIGDDATRAFIQRRFADKVKVALPPPRRRARAVLRALL